MELLHRDNAENYTLHGFVLPRSFMFKAAALEAGGSFQSYIPSQLTRVNEMNWAQLVEKPFYDSKKKLYFNAKHVVEGTVNRIYIRIGNSLLRSSPDFLLDLIQDQACQSCDPKFR
jgi:hypothetical protein